jgi:hypothetical protein
VGGDDAFFLLLDEPEVMLVEDLWRYVDTLA